MNRRSHIVAAAAGLLTGTGELRPTIFAEMSALAARTGAANLGQGFPDEDGPVWLIDAAVSAMRDGANQYPPGRGVAALREAIARHQSRHYSIALDPETEVLVTAGATEAIASAVLALCGPGDEVLSHSNRSMTRTRPASRWPAHGTPLRHSHRTATAFDSTW